MISFMVHACFYQIFEGVWWLCIQVNVTHGQKSWMTASSSSSLIVNMVYCSKSNFMDHYYVTFKKLAQLELYIECYVCSHKSKINLLDFWREFGHFLSVKETRSLSETTWSVLGAEEKNPELNFWLRNLKHWPQRLTLSHLPPITAV